jgi:hypothetical protein
MSTSIIIRLQHLPLEANSVDIRKFFAGLSIPDGGVHIVGGVQGDAFIAFASDEDARQAMAKDGEKIRGSAVKLLLSSRNEMKKVIDAVRLALNDPSKVGLSSQPTVSPVQANNQGQNRVPQQSQSNYPNQAASQSMIPNMNQLNQRPVQGNLPQNSQQPPLKRERSRSPLGRQLPTNGVSNNGMSIGMTPMAGLRPMAGLVPQMMSNPSMNVMNRLGGFAPDIRQPTISVQIANPQANNPGQFGSGDAQSGPGWSRRLPDFNQPPNQNNFQNNNVGNPLDMNVSRRPNVQGLQNIPAQTFMGRVEMRGLPFQVTPRDIQDFFRMNSSIFVPEDFIRILVDDNFKTTGGATVRFNTEQEHQMALSLNGKFMGDRRIDVMNLPDIPAQPMMGLPNNGVVGHIPGLQNQPQTQQQTVIQVPPRDYVIYMKGIPFNACTEGDVRRFFQNLQVQEIVFEMDVASGKLAGNAFVELPTKEDYEGALDMNRKYMGRRYIGEVISISDFLLLKLFCLKFV